jgi:hypothetical protein
MKCQACEEQATHHVTELVAGKPEEYHVCEKHLQDLSALEAKRQKDESLMTFGGFFDDPELRAALVDPPGREKMAAYMLPVLCLGLLDPKPEVRIISAFGLMQFGTSGQSAIQALRDALADQDKRVSKAAQIAIEWIETQPPVRFSCAPSGG